MGFAPDGRGSVAVHDGARSVAATTDAVERPPGRHG